MILHHTDRILCSRFRPTFLCSFVLVAISLTVLLGSALNLVGIDYRPVQVFADHIRTSLPFGKVAYPAYLGSSGSLPVGGSVQDLESVLEKWSQAPVLSYYEASALHKNTCSGVNINHNVDQVRKQSSFWASLHDSSILALRETLIHHLRELRNNGSFAEKHQGQGRGIVLVGGNRDTVKRSLVTLRIIREKYNCTLPAQMFSFPGEIGEEERQQLWELGTEHVELNRVKDTKAWKSFEIKAQSIIESKFRHVLYLDTDNIPARDPTYIFDSAGYQSHGAVFWPDYWKTSGDNPIWNIIGVPCRDEWEQEAGQMYIDKGRHVDALHLANYMQLRHEVWFKFSDGDKDTFRYAWLALGKTWSGPGRYVAAAGLPHGVPTGPFCGHTMLQHDHLGDPLFVHYNLMKSIPSGIGRGNTWGKTQRVRYTMPHEDPETPLGLSSGDRYNISQDSVTVGETGVGTASRRLALADGVQPYFHGGEKSALCIALRWTDPSGGFDRLGRRRRRRPLTPSSSSFESTVHWEDPIESVQWSDDPVLKDFESTFYDKGGQSLIGTYGW